MPRRSASRRAALPIGGAARRLPERQQVQPKARRAYPVLPELLLDDGLLGALAGPEVLGVLAETVELADRAVVLEVEVDPTDRPPLVQDHPLEVRYRKPQSVDQHAAAGFPHALTASVQEPDRPRGLCRAASSSAACNRATCT